VNPVCGICIQEEWLQVQQQQARDSLTRLTFLLRDISFIWELAPKINVQELCYAIPMKTAHNGVSPKKNLFLT
jgi:hypothetical protein